MKERKLNNKGFSLVELIIVIAIMVILVVVIAPQYTKFVKNSRIAADVQTAQAAATAIDVAVAEGKSVFTSNVYNGSLDSVKLPLTSKLEGTFIIEGDNDKGVSKIYLDKPKGETKKFECYPNPDVSGSNPGVNTLKK